MKIKGDVPKVKSITMKTSDKINPATTMIKWWKAKGDKNLSSELLTVAAFLKESQNYRFRQAAVYSRL